MPAHRPAVPGATVGGLRQHQPHRPWRRPRQPADGGSGCPGLRARACCACSSEVLTTNLLPVIEMPPTVYLAPAAFTDYRAAGAALDAQGRRESGWILREGLVLSFRSLRDSLLRVLCDGDAKRHETREWADSDDLDTQYRFADLFSRTVQGSCPELRWPKDRKHMHFRGTSHLGPRKAGRGPGSRCAPQSNREGVPECAGPAVGGCGSGERTAERSGSAMRGGLRASTGRSGASVGHHSPGPGSGRVRARSRPRSPAG